MSDRVEGTNSVWGPIAFAAAVVVMALAVAGSAPAVTGDPTVDVLVRVCLLVAVAAGAVVLLAPHARGTGAPAISRMARAWMIGALVGAFLAAGAALVLSGSRFPPLGVALDQGFRAASVTKYAHTVALVDFAYKGLPAFYPPAYFWVLGRASAWTGIEPYEMLKLGLLGVALAAPLCAVGLWARVTRDWMITVAVAIAVLAFQDWYEPYGGWPQWCSCRGGSGVCCRSATNGPERVDPGLDRGPWWGERPSVRRSSAPTTTASSSARCTSCWCSRSDAPRSVTTCLGSRVTFGAARRCSVAWRCSAPSTGCPCSSRSPPRRARGRCRTATSTPRRCRCHSRSCSSTWSAGACSSVSGTWPSPHGARDDRWRCSRCSVPPTCGSRSATWGSSPTSRCSPPRRSR